jgi:hypothetical protein
VHAPLEAAPSLPEVPAQRPHPSGRRRTRWRSSPAAGRRAGPAGGTAAPPRRARRRRRAPRGSGPSTPSPRPGTSPAGCAARASAPAPPRGRRARWCPAGSPEVWVRSWRTVTYSFPPPENSGRYDETRSSSPILPSSTSSITAVVVPTTLVREARSNTVSSGSTGAESQPRPVLPNPSSSTIVPRRPMASAAPGRHLAAARSRRRPRRGSGRWRSCPPTTARRAHGERRRDRCGAGASPARTRAARAQGCRATPPGRGR